MSGPDDPAHLHDQHPGMRKHQAGDPIDLPSERHQDAWASHELQCPEKRAQFTKALDSIFSVKEHRDTSHSDEHLDKCDFVYDVGASSLKNDFQCRMVLSFRMDVNIMSEVTHRRLNIALQPYYGNTIPALGCGDRKPLGTVDIEWAFCGRMKRYRTTFYVVADVEYDLLLGLPSMWQHELYRVDSEILKRLNAS
ncbi:hypothetical protein AbraIFM66951_001644 [Aspergillus brasiliensis]|uniref:Uncharacterized protein n=1 Tax=Aspergillus brasiliensis TaxID=319629 RepID=A0A9W5YJP1_9EURO|nr:hypothetical protein AbraCBS73388_007239 [Aspergillus brasiliensis]GKZ49240.1 hypothetical protein AbraIFM66951_001644 [Aspergillus brasiliensis]